MTKPKIDLSLLRQKLAEMGAEQVQAESAGMAPPGAVPPGAAPPGAPPMDPAAAGMPVDPATGMPMDPAMMGGGAPPPPPTLDELVASGDPLIKLLVGLDKKIDVVIGALGKFMDDSGMTVPAGQAFEAEAMAASSEVPQPQAKQASAVYNPELLDNEVDDEPGEADDVQAAVLHVSERSKSSGLQISGQPGASLGSSSERGQGSGVPVVTGFNSLPDRSKELSKLWARGRGV